MGFTTYNADQRYQIIHVEQSEVISNEYKSKKYLYTQYDPPNTKIRLIFHIRIYSGLDFAN